MSPEEIARELDLAGRELLWVERLARVEPPPGGLAPYARAEIDDLLARLVVVGEDAETIAATFPSPERAPAWWWLLERCCGRLIASIGRPEARRGWWPDWIGPHVPPAKRCFMAHVFLAVLPVTVRWHESVGVPAGVTQASLRDLPRHLALHRRAYGCTGIDAGWWLTMCLRGEIFDLGRLQFNWFRLGEGDQVPFWYTPEEAEMLGEGFRGGDGCLGVHIPEDGPLDPEACDESIAAAGEFFHDHFADLFPAGRRRLATCLSWLLDEQLADWLASSSNIVRFQRRFQVLRHGYESDREPLDFVFRLPIADPPAGVGDRYSALSWIESLMPVTSLEKALVEHLRSGGHWYVKMGWFDI